jgi:hypothetical protein
MGLESVYYFWITCRNGGFKIQPPCHHKPQGSKKNDRHYVAVSKSPTPGSWYKYDNSNIDLVKFVKRNTNSVLMDFQKTISILFHIDVKYVCVCYNNLCNNDEVIDHMGGGIETIHRSHERPPRIVQLEDNTLSSLSSNTSSLLLSDTLSMSSSNNSSRFSTSVRSKTNSNDGDLFLSSSQATKNGKSYSKYKMSENQHANYVLSFCNWAMGNMSEVAMITHIKNSV